MVMPTTLDNIRKLQEDAAEREAARNRPKADYFKFPNPRQRVATGRFLQELDPAASGYREDRGTAVIVPEHEAPGPKGFQRRGLCSLEEENQCYADEQRRAFPEEGWKNKTNFYINVLVDYGDGKPQVVVLSRNFNSAFVQQLIEYAIADGTITEKNFKITATGEGTKSNWLPMKLDRETPFDDSEAEVFDIHETVLRKIPYDKQADYYGAVFTREEAKPDKDSEPSDEAAW